MQNKADLIFMKWKADLADMDRSKEAVEGNFDLLFDQLQRAKVKMNDALPYLDKATKAHYPKLHIVKNTFKRIKHFGKSENVQDFENNWKEFIGDAAKRVFFSLYDIEGVDKTEKKYGNMSASEYRKQHKYADSHPTIDWEAIIAERDSEDSKETPNINVDDVDLDIDLGDL